MNVYDSEQIAGVLEPLRYKVTPNPEQADLIIVNTCAIREKAQQKAFSFLGRLAEFKRKNPDLIIGIGGCVAQQEGKKILRQVPHIDLVFGTHAISRLPHIIKQIELKKFRVVDVEMSGKIDEFEPIINPPDVSKASRFVTIMQGCDNYCTYCVVPFVRGKETSRNPENIIKEIKCLVDSGVREVTLLGQNVNSYGKKERMCSFAELLAVINEIKGLQRIRFTTSHPKDLSSDLVWSFNNLAKLCRHIHLPVQSGSNRILKRMNRKYTRELYLEKVAELKKICPDIAITSDIIVGFPGETDSDFNETLDLIKKVEYDGLYAFMYSDRPNATAAQFTGKISNPEKKVRLQVLLDLQKEYTVKKNQAIVGSTELILVEGFSKKQKNIKDPGKCNDIQWTGRTSTNKIVNFIQGGNNIGRYKNRSQQIATGNMLNLVIEKAFLHSLWGKLD